MQDSQADQQHMMIDTDAGIDDALAILCVSALPEISLEAVTCTAGNTSLEFVTNNVLLTLDQTAADVPVYAGCARPLVGSAPDASEIMGPDGLGGATQYLPTTNRRLCPTHAALAILQHTRQTYPVSLLALGPLTNLALALGLDDGLPSRMEKIVAMGGTINAQGNASPAAEFNFYYDPEAAFSLLHAGVNEFVLVPWETCTRSAIPWNMYKELCHLGTRRSDFFRLITANLAPVLDGQYHLPGLVLPDVLAAGIALDPSLAVEVRPVAMDVLIQQGAGRGFSVIDWMGMGGNPPNVQIVMAIDEHKLNNFLLSVLEHEN